jgi:hypothetical protein
MTVTYNWRRRGCGDLEEYICILHTHFCIQSTNFDSRSSPLWILPDLDAGRRAHGLLVGQAGFSRKPAQAHDCRPLSDDKSNCTVTLCRDAG